MCLINPSFDAHSAFQAQFPFQSGFFRCFWIHFGKQNTLVVKQSPYRDAHTAQCANLWDVPVSLLWNRCKLSSVGCFFFVYWIIFFCLRSKLAFANGTPSDSISFVNAFKVMCVISSWQNVFLFNGFAYLTEGFACCLFLLDMVLCQEERTAETPQGEQNNNQTSSHKHEKNTQTLFLTGQKRKLVRFGMRFVHF